MTRALYPLPLLVALTLSAQPRVLEEMIPMRDGTKLATTIVLPMAEGKYSAVLTRTPYGKDRMYAAAKQTQWVDAGYARVVQDVRGKFKSEGKYRAFTDDMLDSYDTIEWIAKQPWANGKVGMEGPSAMGIITNLAAMSGAPHLTCAYVTVGHGSGYRYASHPGGVFLKNMNEEWLKAQGVPMDERPRPTFKDYGPDDKEVDMRTYASKIKVPMYNLGGWYDIFLQGDVDSYMLLQQDGGPGARGNQKLAMGAFGHGPLSGDLKYPAEAGNLANGVDEMRWFEYWLKGVDNGIMKEPPVKYFLMGDTMDKSAPGNEWRTASSWPPSSTSTAYYLGPQGKLSTLLPVARSTAKYVYDPKNPVPSAGGNNLMMARGPMDQRKVSNRPDVLKFETEPLAAPLEIVGPVKVQLAVSTDAPDTDFMVKLVDVYPNGYEALVLDEAQMLRYRNGLKPEKAEPGKVYPITVDLWSTALVFNKGHKISVQVSSSNTPRFEAHTNTWEPVSSYDLAQKATNVVFLDGRSKLILPVTKVYKESPIVAN